MLKKTLFLILFSLTVQSQNLSEILNLTTDIPNGTARFESMGGAFGALGVWNHQNSKIARLAHIGLLGVIGLIYTISVYL